MPRLGFFTSVDVPQDVYDAFSALEDILQVEHNSDGRHKLSTPTEDGFMSADDKKRLDELWAVHSKAQEAEHGRD